MSGVPTISYSTLSVLFDSIPVWGICHKRIGTDICLVLNVSINKFMAKKIVKWHDVNFDFTELFEEFREIDYLNSWFFLAHFWPPPLLHASYNLLLIFYIGNNVILMDDTGGLTCYKCFNLVLRSSNVLQIHTAGLDKCYTTEERAIADCPSDMMIRERRAREIMLYRKFT